jgi:hypothetical protein
LTVPSAVFGMTVSSLTFFGFTIPPLRFTVVFSPGRQAAFITTVRLPTPAAPANVKNQATPSTFYLEQQQNRHASELVNARSM